ncbi:cache domain-containing protein [Sinorhizobium meliloti]|uniref:cache domain-containing protein n=1 Tax=Rhizobium meliloti TaxID=382 RepID=UPI001F3E3A21|nr:cache domain-containing protein [Sinorhizobium meliloti]
MYRPKLAQVIIVILMLAVLSTAALIHLIWQRAAGENIEEIVASLDAQTAASVRNDLSRTLSLVSSTAEVVRSIFFQGAISANDEVKREFLFLSLLREQPAIAWIGFGFPDGRFFGSHATADGRIEMVEIGAAEAGELRPLRRDLYRPIPGDIFFEERIRAESAYVALGAPWYRLGKENGDPVWTVTNVLPNGFEPAMVLSKRVVTFGKFTGVVMAAVSLRRLSEALQALELPALGKAFVLDSRGRVLATSQPSDGVMAAHFSDFPASDAIATAAAEAVAANQVDAFRAVVSNALLGPVFVSSSRLPFENWRLVIATPRSTFASGIDKNIRRIALVVLAMAALAAATAVAFANFLFARPLARVAEQLRAVERFSLESIRHHPTFLAELNDLSQALKRMAAGLSAFARYMPLDVVRSLVEGGVEPKPGGELCADYQEVGGSIPFKARDAQSTVTSAIDRGSQVGGRSTLPIGRSLSASILQIATAALARHLSAVATARLSHKVLILELCGQLNSHDYLPTSDHSSLPGSAWLSMLRGGSNGRTSGTTRTPVVNLNELPSSFG